MFPGLDGGADGGDGENLEYLPPGRSVMVLGEDEQSIIGLIRAGDGRDARPQRPVELACAVVPSLRRQTIADEELILDHGFGHCCEERHIIGQKLGLLAEPEPLVRAEARKEREGLLAMLHERGMLGVDPSERQVVEAMHRLVQRAPSALFGVALVDGVGERRAQNQPGTDTEYANWKVPLGDSNGRTILLDELFTQPRLRSLIAAIRR